MLLLFFLLQDSAVERYLAEKDRAGRARILAEIRAPAGQVEAELRKPPRRPDLPVKGQMVRKRREAYPARVGLATNERVFNRNFWLEVAEFREKEIIKRGFLDLERKNIEDRLVFQNWVIVTAELAREANEIKIAASGARELRVYLHERMVDFGRPLVVTVNGVRSRFEPKPSLEVLLESARRDRGLLYTASVKVRVP